MNHLRQRILISFVCSAILFSCGGGSATKSDAGTSSCNTMPTGADMGSCSAAEIAPYNTCLQTACDSQFKTCFGPNYKAGSYGGACAAYLTCTSKCACNDTTCASTCTPDATCLTCLLGTISCSGSCTAPACASTTTGTGGSTGTTGTGGKSGGGTGGKSGGGTGGSGSVNLDAGIPNLDALISTLDAGGTCADLQKCCNSMTDATAKATCLSEYAQISALGDTFCGIAYSTIKADGLCP